MVPFIDPESGMTDPKRMDILLDSECNTIRQKFTFASTSKNAPVFLRPLYVRISLCENLVPACAIFNEAVVRNFIGTEVSMFVFSTVIQRDIIIDFTRIHSAQDATLRGIDLRFGSLRIP